MAKPIWSGTTSNDYAVTTNWTTGTVPTTGDAVFLTTGAANPIGTSLDQHTVAIASFTTDMGFNSTVGDAANYLQIAAPVATLGLPLPVGSGSGSRRINLNFGATAAIVTVLNSPNQGTDPGMPPVRLLGTSLTVNALGGLTGIAVGIGETSTLTAVMVDGGTLILGPGAAVTTITIQSGMLISSSTSTVTTATIQGQNSQLSYVANGSGAHTTLTINSGTVQHNGGGTITDLTLGVGATYDRSNTITPVTITNCTRYPGAKILDPNGTIIFTNPWQDAGAASLADNRSTFGPNRTYQVV